jgi:TolA-binding protein
MGGKPRGLLTPILLLIVLCLVLFTPLPSSGSSPQELLQVGTGSFNDGFYQVAEANFKEFLQTYPQHNHCEDAMYLLGKALYEQKKYDEATDVFVELLINQKAFRAIDAAYFWLGRSYEKMDDLDNAQNNFLTIVTKYPKSVWYHTSFLLLGKISFQEGRYKRAEMYLRKAHQDEDIAPELLISVKFWLGLALYEQGRYKEAENYLSDVVKNDVQVNLREEALYWLGEIYIKLEKYRRAIPMFRSLLKSFPQSSLYSHALYGESLSLYMCDRKEEALKGLVTLKNGFSHTLLLPHIMYLMGKIYIDLNRYSEGIEILKEFLDRFPHNHLREQTLLVLAWCYIKREDLERVQEITYEIVKHSPDERSKSLAQYILAELNTYESNSQEAMPYWFNLLNAISYRREALFKIALCSFQEKKYKESLVNIDLLQLEYPNFYKMDAVLWIQGESYMELGNIPEAIKAYARIIKEYKKSSWYPWSIYRLIAISMDEKNIQEAERYFEMVRKRYPTHELSFKAALTIGIEKAEAKKYESSLNYLNFAVHSPNRNIMEHALCLQGAIYLNIDEYRKALDSYQIIEAGNPSSATTRNAIAFLEIGNIRYLLNDLKKAKEAYKKAIDLSQDEIFREKVKKLLKR